jgi:sarcosine oxidase subunit gamma
MAETTQHASRRMALGEIDAKRSAGIPPDAVVIRLLAPRARFSLRLVPSLLSTTQQVAGFTLDMPINRCISSAGKTAMRLGPDEWLLSGPEGDAARIALDALAALAGLHHSLVDVSHRHVALSVAGARAADVINSGCPLELTPSAFLAGCATRTLLGKCEMILAKTDDLPTFAIECGRSFAAYVHDFLLEAAREFCARDVIPAQAGIHEIGPIVRG